MNEVLGDEEPRILQHVRDRYLIRTRADIPTAEARSGSTMRRDSAFRSGALSTSWYRYSRTESVRFGLYAETSLGRATGGTVQSVKALPGCREGGRIERSCAAVAAARNWPPMTGARIARSAKHR